MAVVVPQCLDPLGGLPSLLSLTRLEGRGEPRRIPQRADVVPLLLADPVLTLRALRLCRAAVLGERPLPLVSAHAILERLGPGPLGRMASAPAAPVADTHFLFRLWRHALAAAVAARSLAEIGAFDPEVDPGEAYIAALVHDLPLWGHLATRASTTTSSPWGPLEWGKAWRMPDQVQVSWLAAHCGTTHVTVHAGLARTVVAAEAIAILAGHPHPGGACRIEADLMRELAGPKLASLVEQVRTGMRQVLADAGLELGQLEQPPTPETIHHHGSALPHFEEGVVKLLELGESERYRPVLTSLTAAICHYLGYDRAFYVQWVGKGHTLLIRTKYDRTAVPVGGRLLVPSAVEAALMGRAAGFGKPEVLRRNENFRFRLLDHLASDTLLVVPVCGGATVHGLLLLDRAYSAQQQVAPADPTKALAIAGTCGQILAMLNLKKQGQRSRKEAETDSLTGLLNRRTALSQLEREIQRIRRTRQPMVVLMLDLDHFKSMNDTYGHLTGDRILAKIGSVLKATLRGADIAARYGGEEFLVLQFDTTLEDASIVATRIYKAVEEAGRELAVPITVSIGVTDLRPDDTVESVLHRADKALYASKQRGRNRFSVDSQ